MHRVALLCFVHLLGQEGDGTQAVALVLLQHSSQRKARCVRLHHEGKSVVRQRENRGGLNRLLDLIERSLLLLSPTPRGSVLGQLGEWSGQRTEIANELAVVSSRAKERTNIEHAFRRRPLGDGANLVLHHAYAVGSHAVA